MAGSLTSTMCTSFKKELMTATHNFTLTTGHTIKCALFRAGASLVGTYGAATTNYSDMTGNSDEVTGAGYSAGGVTLTNATPTTSGTTAIADFNDPAWAASTVTARGALLYNSSASNKAIAVIDFGADKVTSGATFIVILPTADATNAIVRLV